LNAYNSFKLNRSEPGKLNMPFYIWFLFIVLIFSLIGYWINAAEASYLAIKASRMIKKSRKKSHKNKKNRKLF